MIIIWLVGDVECNQIHFGFNFVRIWLNNIKLVYVKFYFVWQISKQKTNSFHASGESQLLHAKKKKKNNIHIKY